MLVEEEGKGGGRDWRGRAGRVKKGEVEREGKIKMEGKRDKRETGRGVIGV